jgi:hypothetical protein
VDGRLSDLQRLVAAIGVVRPEMARLAGADWPELRDRLDALLDQVRRQSAPAPLLAARLRVLIATYAAVHQRIQEVLAAPPAPEPTEFSSPSRGQKSLGPAARVPPDGPPRFVNLAVLRAVDFGRIPANRPLAPHTAHLLRINIGAVSAESVVRDAVAQVFPASRLPPTVAGHWLEIAVASADFDTPTRTFPVFLPLRGQSWVCRCQPESSHTCRPGEREAHVLVPVRTPAAPGTAHLRIGVWFRTALVQSLALVADIASPPAAGAHAATVDYTLTANLSDLDSVPPRALSVITNQRPDGTHTLVFNSGTGEVTFTLAEGHLANAMATVRDMLLDFHVERVGRSRRSRLDARNAKRRNPFIGDLERLARNGWRLWASLFNQQPVRLRGAATGPANTIQIARVPSSGFVFPWAAVYDLPLDAAPDARYDVCRIVAAWDSAAPMLDGYPTACPASAEHRPSNTLCPFGFWGVRHSIEHPPSTVGRPLPREVRVVGEPAIVVVRSLGLDPDLTARHIDAIGKTLPGFSVIDVATRREACTALADHDLELVEFYCHGRADPERVWLEVGRDEQIHPEQITTWTVVDWAPPEEHWRATTPLVLLNGCHTAELTPQSPVSFVDCFAAANAGGVIGTEITLDQRLANEAGQLLLSHFASGVGVGEAVRRMRCDLLNKGNLAGLAYTAYCSADLRLVR